MLKLSSHEKNCIKTPMNTISTLYNFCNRRDQTNTSHVIVNDTLCCFLLGGTKYEEKAGSGVLHPGQGRSLGQVAITAVVAVAAAFGGGR